VINGSAPPNQAGFVQPQWPLTALGSITANSIFQEKHKKNKLFISLYFLVVMVAFNVTPKAWWCNGL
jgi:hypothetical protein